MARQLMARRLMARRLMARRLIARRLMAHRRNPPRQPPVWQRQPDHNTAETAPTAPLPQRQFRSQLSRRGSRHDGGSPADDSRYDDRRNNDGSERRRRSLHTSNGSDNRFRLPPTPEQKTTAAGRQQDHCSSLSLPEASRQSFRCYHSSDSADSVHGRSNTQVTGGCRRRRTHREA